MASVVNSDVVNSAQGRLARRLLLTRQIRQIQASGQLWRPSEGLSAVDMAVYVEALAEIWLMLAQRLEIATWPWEAQMSWVNCQLQQRYVALLGEWEDAE
jgi:hypothetical protein